VAKAVVEAPATPVGYEVHPLRGRGEFTFTYYWDDTEHSLSFRKVARCHVREMRRRGLAIRAEPRNWLMMRNMAFKEQAGLPVRKKWVGGFAIVQPLFPVGEYGLRCLLESHRHIVGIEVADTDEISGWAVDFLNDRRIDAICLPSMFAVEAYRRSGVVNRVAWVPHGLDEIYRRRRGEIRCGDRVLRRLREDERVKILFFCLHSSRRKGMDVAFEAVRRLNRGDAVLVVKTRGINYSLEGMMKAYPDVPVINIHRFLSEEELVYLYDSCDILLMPSRGGGFELNGLEAMARGLPVVATGGGAWLEYADIHNAYLIRCRGRTGIFEGGIHCGLGYEPDVEHATQLLRFLVENLEWAKKKAEMQSRAILRKYTWRRSVDLLLEVCEEVWEGHP